MTDHPVTASIDAQRWLWETARQLVEMGDAGAEQLLRMLTTEVAHTESEVIYRENKLAVHHYEPAAPAHGTPILIVYALVNRPYILDLQPDRSVIRTLREAGFDVYLIDWGEPSRLDTALELSDYVCRYLDNCVEAVCDHAAVEDVHLLGYCMGGTLTLMYTALDDARVRTLGLMATPVSFDGEGGILERWATHYDPELAAETMGNIPAELLAMEFSMMDPVESFVTKYVRLFENLENDAFVENFARMERWIWDGVDVAGATFEEFVGEVYKDNRLAENRFELAGEPIDLGAIEAPLLGIVGEHDHIVPAASSKPVHDAVGSADETLIEFPAGHIGISVSSAAHEDLWPRVTDWFAARSASRQGSTGPASEGSVADAAKRAVASTADQAATVEAAPAQTDGSGGVTSIAGIGPTYADRLAAAGIETAADLAAHDATELATIAETSPGRTEQWLEQVAERP